MPHDGGTKKPAVIGDGGFLWRAAFAGALFGRDTFQMSQLEWREAP
jgi:hypothetical protein